MIILLCCSYLFPDTIIDSIYAVPELDGDICYTPSGQLWSINDWSYDMHAGDLGEGAAPPSGSSIRAFVSFELPDIPEGYEIDSVFIRLYQFDSHGGSYDDSTGYTHYDFPYWDIAGGDTVQCIMSHIDYGFELDPGDWAKGDEENTYTYNHNIGMITDSGIDGYRYLDATSSVVMDYHLGRLLNQYRISFEIDTDWDVMTDKLTFDTGEHWDSRKPQLKLYLSDEVDIIDNSVIQTNFNFIFYPNPISGKGTILLSTKQSTNISVDLFNLKGQLVRNVFTGNIESGENEFLFDAKELSTGIYFLMGKTNQKKYVKKIIIQK